MVKTKKERIKYGKKKKESNMVETKKQRKNQIW